MINLSAEILLRMNQAAVRQVVSQTTQAIRGISAQVSVKVDPAAQAQLNALSSNIGKAQQGLASLTVSADAAAAAISRTARAMSAANSSGAAQGLNSSANAARSAARAYGEAASGAENFGRLTALSARRFAAFTVSVGAIGQAFGVFRNGIGDAVKYNLEMNKLTQVSEEGRSAVGAISAEIDRLSTSLGVSRQELAGVSVEFKQAGLSINDTKIALEAIAKAQLAPSFGSAKQVTEGAIAAFQQFGKSAVNLKEQLGSINAVAQGFAVEAADLITVVQKTGGAFKAAGGDFNELLALFTSVRSTTRESAEEIATGLRTIFTRLQRSETVNSLKALGVELRYTRDEAAALGQSGLENQFVGVNEAVRRLSEGLSKLRTTDPRFAAIEEQLGGFRQVSRVIPLIQEYGEAQKALNVAKLGGVSLDVAAAQRQDALATKFSKVNQELGKLISSVAESKGFNTLVEGMTGLAVAALKLLDYLKPLVPTLISLAAIKFGQNLGGFVTGVVGGLRDRTASEISAGSRQPRRFARGGVVPGSGNLDSEHALLMPGEFVVKKQSAQRIGYDVLHQLNNGRGPRRFADGGEVSLEDLFARINARLSGRQPRAGGSAPAGGLSRERFDAIASRFDDPYHSVTKLVGDLGKTKKLDQILGAIPADAEYFSHGTEALVLKTPRDEIIRLARIIKQQRTSRGDRFLGRPAIPEVLQPNASTKVGQFLVENLPFAPPADGNDPRTRSAIASLRRGVESRGYKATDLTPNNVGFLPDGSPTIIDPGAVRKYAVGGRVNLFEAMRKPALRAAVQAAVGLGGFFAGSDLKQQEFFGKREVAEARAALDDSRRGHSLAGARPYAKGGHADTDTVHALLTPGEFVMNRSAVDRLGVHTLRHMNQNGELPQRFASGGPVRFAGGDSVPQKFQINEDTDRTATRAGFDVLATQLGIADNALVRFNRAVGAAIQAMGLTAKEAKDVEVIYGLQKKKPVFKGFVGFQDEGVPLPAAAIKAQREERLNIERRQIPPGLTEEQEAEARKKVKAGIPLDPTQANLADQYRARVKQGKALFEEAQVPSSQEVGTEARASARAREAAERRQKRSLSKNAAAALNVASTVTAATPVETLPSPPAGPAFAQADMQRLLAGLAREQADLQRLFAGQAQAATVRSAGGISLGQPNIDRLLAGTPQTSPSSIILPLIQGVINAKSTETPAQAAQATAAVQTYQQMQSQLKALKAEGFFKGDLRQKSGDIAGVLQEALARKAAVKATTPPAESGPAAPQAAAARNYPLVPYVPPVPPVPPQLAIGMRYLTGPVPFYGVRKGEPLPSQPATPVTPADIAAGREQAIIDRRERRRNRLVAGGEIYDFKAADDKNVDAQEAARIAGASAGRDRRGGFRALQDFERQGQAGAATSAAAAAAASAADLAERAALNRAAFKRARADATAAIGTPGFEGAAQNYKRLSEEGSALRQEKASLRSGVGEAGGAKLDAAATARLTELLSRNGDDVRRARSDPSAAQTVTRLLGERQALQQELYGLRKAGGTAASRGEDRAAGILLARDARGPAVDLRAEQERLTGRKGSAAFDPVDIAARLSQTRASLRRSRQVGADALGSGDDASAALAAEAYKDLLGHQQNLRKALSNIGTGVTGAGTGGVYRLAAEPGRPTDRAAAAAASRQEQLDTVAAIKAAEARERAATLTSGLRVSSANDVVGFRTTAAIGDAGGAGALSGRSLEELSAKQLAKVEKELTDGIVRQLRALNPAIAATEARRKAEELAAHALQNNEQLLRNSRQGAVGLASLGRQLVDQGLPAVGTRGGFGGVVDSARRLPGRIGGGIRNSLGAQGNFAGVYALSAVAPVLGSAFDPSDDDARLAAASGNTSGFTSRRAAGGVLQGAGFGAAIGASFGGVGAPVGAAVGALVGFTAAVREAERTLNDASLANAVHKFAERIDGLASGKVLANSAGEGEAVGAIAGARIASNKKADSASSGFIFSASEKETSDARRAELRNTFGGQAGNIVGVLTKSAQDAAAANPRSSPGDLAKTLQNGLSGELVRLTADIRGVPVREVLDELTKTIQQAQRNISVSEEGEKNRRELDKNVSSFGRLADAVGNAAASVQRFDTRLSSLQGIFSGSSSGVKVGGLDEGFKQIGAASGDEFRVALGRVSGALGEGGEKFRQTGEAGDTVSRLLPGILGEVAKGGLTGDKLAGNSARDLLLDRLFPKVGAGKGREDALAANPELAKAVNAVTSGLNAKSADPKAQAELGHNIRDNANKLSQELLDGFIGPMKEAGERIAKALEHEANRLVDGLAVARQQLIAIGESQDKVGDIRLAGQRAGAAIESEKTGRPTDSFLSLDDLQAPFNERQNRLAGGAGRNAFDVNEIAGRLAANRGQVAAAGKARDEAVGTKGFGAAAANFDRLTAESNNLQRALHNLADVGTRAAGIQEKLNALQASKDSRLGYAEKYLTASPEQQARMQRGQELVGSLQQNPNNFQRLDDEEKKIALESLNDFGNSKLANGQTGLGLKKQVLEGALAANGGAQSLSPDDQKAEAQLQDELKNVFAEGEKAQLALVQFQKDTNKEFLAGLKESMDAFFNRLATNLLQEKLGGLENQKAGALAEKGDLDKQVGQRNLLAKAGITSDAGIKNAQSQAGDIADFFAASKKLNEATKEGPEQLAERVQKAVTASAAVNGGALAKSQSQFQFDSEHPQPGTGFGRKALDRRDGIIGQVLKNSKLLDDLGGDDRDRVVAGVQKGFGAEFGARSRAAGGNLNPEQQQQVATETVAALAKRELEGLKNSRVAELEKAKTEAGSKLTGQVKAENLAGIGGGEQEQFLTALKEGFNKSGQSLDTLTTRYEANRKSIDDFTEAINRARASIASGKAGGAPAEGFANGGQAVFAPRGSDTVPAMLTPGEFVVSKAAAQKNMALLQHLNRGGTSYYADGGEVDPLAQRNAIRARLGLPPVTASPANNAEARARLGLPETSVGNVGFGIGRLDPKGGLTAINDYRSGLGLNFLDATPAAAVEADRAGIRQRLGLPAEESGRVGVIPAPPRLPARPRTQTSVRRGPTPAQQLLALNDAFNRSNLAQQQAVARGTGLLPGDEDQAAIAGRALTTQRENINKQFQEKFGRDVYGERAARISGDFQSRQYIQEQLAKQRKQKVRRFADGGLVPGHGNVDDQPAMLTSGEFVMNKHATRAIGPDVLATANRFASGGMVGTSQYLAGGGQVAGGSGGAALSLTSESKQAFDGFQSSAAKIAEAIGGFGGQTAKFVEGIGVFGSHIEKLQGFMEKFPTEMKHQHSVAPVEVIINGQQAVSEMKDGLASMFQGMIDSSISKALKSRFPHA